MTLQPIDAPPTATELLHIVGQLDSEDILMFSSDYPHWHFDAAGEAFPAQLPQSLDTQNICPKTQENSIVSKGKYGRLLIVSVCFEAFKIHFHFSLKTLCKLDIQHLIKMLSLLEKTHCCRFQSIHNVNIR